MEEPCLVAARHTETWREKISDACHPAHWARTLSRLQGRSRGLPREVIRMDFPELSRALKQLLRRHRFDLVQLEYTAMAQYLDVVRAWSPQSAVVLEEIDVSYVAMERRLSFDDAADRDDLRNQLERMRSYERSQWRLFDAVVTMSEVERLEVAEGCDPDRVWVVPNGVDISYFFFRPRGRKVRPRILFLGSLLHPPNSHGLKVFLTKIWPELSKRYPFATFEVLGEGASKELLSLSSESVYFHGFVGDIRPILSNSSLLVVPIWTGSGTRLKVLEAFASGLPVVSTRLGCEGLLAEPDQHFFLADHPDEFSDCIGRLISEPGVGGETASRARLLVEKLYHWDAVSEQAEAVWEAAAKGVR